MDVVNPHNASAATATFTERVSANIDHLDFPASDDPRAKCMVALLIDHSNNVVLEAVFRGHAAAGELDTADVHMRANGVSRLHERFGHDVGARHERALNQIVSRARAPRSLER